MLDRAGVWGDSLTFTWRRRHVTADWRLTILAIFPRRWQRGGDSLGRKIHDRFEQIQAKFSDISSRARRISPSPHESAPTLRRRRS